ncbi:MAG: 50S ribosomal protein L11 methyltransferase [Hyphomicrobium sp.]
MRIEYHRTLIADKARNEALFAALERVIVKGKTVVADIGAGSGLLGLMASKLGAKEVHLYEASEEVASVAASVLKQNRARNCHLYPCRSTDMIDAPQVDLIISETLGNYALEENILETLANALERMLKPGGIVIPARIRQFACPVTSPRLTREMDAWRDVGHGLDLEPARTMSVNNVYVRTIEPAELLDGGRAAKMWDDIDLTKPQKGTRKGEMTWTLERDTWVYGFAYWWTAGLVGDLEISTAPDAPRTHWEQLYFPLDEPIPAKAGERILLSLRSRSSEETGTHLAWTAVHSDAAGKTLSRQAMDLDKGWIS